MKTTLLITAAAAVLLIGSGCASEAGIKRHPAVPAENSGIITDSAADRIEAAGERARLRREQRRQALDPLRPEPELRLLP